MVEPKYQIKWTSQYKKDISSFCEQVGMTVSGLYNVFTKQVLREGRIPFDVAVDRPNRKTIKAMKEGDRIAADPNVKGYNNVHDLMEALLK